MRTRTDAGFTITDTIISVGIAAVLSAMAVPLTMGVAGNVKLGNALREVERELQTARLTAVSSNRPIRVRFNCPELGQYRMVELLGTPAAPHADDADDVKKRCQLTSYPYPGDTDRLTRPNHDGPIRRLPTGISFGAAPTLEFRPDGSVAMNAASGNPWPPLSGTGTAVTITKDESVRSITVNGIGKVTYVK